MAEPDATEPSVGLPHSALGQNQNWKRLWLGQGISLTGDYIFDVTVMLWIAKVLAHGKPWAPAAAAGVLIAAAIPALVLGPFAGVFVDRWNRRRTMLTADACRAVLIVLLLPLAFPAVAASLSPVAVIVIIYVVVATASCFAQFFNPSRFAILGTVVAADDLPKASGRLQATGSFAAIIGPPLAAPLLFTAGVQWSLIINSLSFGASFVTIFMVRLAPSAAKPTSAPGKEAASKKAFGREFTAGLRFFRASPVLVAVTVGVVVATLGSGVLNALNVFFIQANLHVSQTFYGTLGMGEGAGAIAGALIAGWIIGRLTSARVFWLGMILAGLIVLVYSRTTNLIAAILVLAVAGASVGIINTALSPLLFGETPQEMIGRVIAVINPIQQLAAILSMTMAGLLTSTVLRGFHHVIHGVTFGPYDTVFAAAAVLFIMAGILSITPLRHAKAATSEAKVASDETRTAEASP
jgi:MFS family permease